MRILTIMALALVSISAKYPSNFESISDVDSSIQVEARYFTEDNFVGSVVDGYLAGKCLLSDKASNALKKAQKLAQKEGYSIKAFDCYRPQMAVDHFVRWGQDLEDTKTKEKYYPNIEKSKLFDLGYISKKSGHSRGSTVDLTLTKNGKELDMGTAWDFLDTLSNTADSRIGKEQMKNRMLLKGFMEKAGFKNYHKEWWHYTLNDEPHPNTYFAFPVR